MTYNKLSALTIQKLEINVGSLDDPALSPSVASGLQYNDATDVVASYSIGWPTSADAGFYLVYNEMRDDDGVFH